jgi:hypothetical protein
MCIFIADRVLGKANTEWRTPYPEVVHWLLLLLDEIGELDLAVGNEVVGRHGGVVPRGEAQLLGVAQQVRGERLVPDGIAGLVLRRRALDRNLSESGTMSEEIIRYP